jgi:hypothetical protein
MVVWWWNGAGFTMVRTTVRWRHAAVRLVVALLLVSGLMVATLHFLAPAPPPGVRLVDLTSLGQLQALFNADQGEPRLILIASPT